MKAVAKFFCVGVAVAFISGCASDVVYVPKIPQQAHAKLLDYYDQPDNKVFVIAIDPSGDYAFGYDYGKSTLKEAAQVAVEQCKANSEAMGVLSKPYIYAINNKVVYEEMIRKSENAKREASSEAQVDEAAAQEEASSEAQVDEAAAQEEAGEADQSSE